MENDINEGFAYSRGRKFFLEFCDFCAGLAFPFIITVLLSATVIAFACTEDLTVSLIALIGGEAMLGVALFAFGKANGATAYRKYVLNSKKRELHSSDERAVYHTGEYALWKGMLLGFLVTVPFIIVQTVELCVSNLFCDFCLKYVFAWAYYPFSYLGERFAALSYIMILFPVVIHSAGYVVGKNKEIKLQEQLAEETEKRRKKRKK